MEETLMRSSKIGWFHGEVLLLEPTEHFLTNTTADSIALAAASRSHLAIFIMLISGFEKSWMDLYAVSTAEEKRLGVNSMEKKLFSSSEASDSLGSRPLCLSYRRMRLPSLGARLIGTSSVRTSQKPSPDFGSIHPVDP
ncbi:hypothetical protein C4D60_Mb02t01600 [Musa balbisiana]|uniref:Uncharacterized protein n=1 Tax=Musa balbisiana TaxID=52838 RepID=A0A4S8I8D7_MUSBA|nr:hypothetical protein C4D60_Mb02t01600 [Musa balbisiana]